MHLREREREKKGSEERGGLLLEKEFKRKDTRNVRNVILLLISALRTCTGKTNVNF